ncbi:type II toxin-antitoxin system Phd/YefM family antitoxin [Kitasatospora sp. NPDC101801]|uniref:type II toxin-antitoxin system Phd/YefM family antitoxin n=1 Tax=Kitasatospora sp. NPDC101801 TaxID=3364103 RepID=UPI0038099AF5
MTTESQGRPDLPANVPTVALADARAELSKIVTLAEHTGRITAITRYGKPVAAVVPAALLHLLSGAHIGPRPIESSEMERLASRARAASQRLSSEDISAAVDDVRAEGVGQAESAHIRVFAESAASTLAAAAQSGEPGIVAWNVLAARVHELFESRGADPEMVQALAALPEDLTMADLLEAWAEKQQGGSR